MFAQVIQGQVGDAAALRGAIDRWVQNVSPGAIGWLGSTGGVTEDGRFIAIVRFESAGRYEGYRYISERVDDVVGFFRDQL